MPDHSTLVVTDKSAVTMTSTTAGTTYLAERYLELVAYVNVTAASGSSPTLDVSIQASPDDSVWSTLASFTQQTTTSTAGSIPFKQTTNFGKYIRLNYVIAGSSASFTLTSKIVFKT